MSPEQHAIDTMWRWWTRVAPAITAPAPGALETRTFDQVLHGSERPRWVARRVKR